MKLTLRDPVGNSIVLESSVTDILAIQTIAEKHIIAPTETRGSAAHSDIFVDDIFTVITEYVESTRAKP